MRSSSKTVLAYGATCFSLVASAPAALVQYWRFDDGSGTTASNSAAGGNVGTLVGGPDWITTGLAPELTSRPGDPSTAALDFEQSEYVDGGNLNLVSDASGGEATVSMWVRRDSSVGDERLWGHVSGSPEQAGAPRYHADTLEVWDGGVWQTLGGALLGTGEWHHLALVWNMGQVTAYVDGTATGAAIPADFEFGSSNGNFGIAARYISIYGNTFPGAIDDVAIWDEALNSTRIGDLAAGASPVPEPSTAAVLLGVAGITLLRSRKSR